MPASLAEQLAQAWLDAQRMDLSLDWPNLPSEERAVWEAVAAVARDLCASAIVGYRCVCGRDHMFETREQVAEQRDEALRQRDEAQRAVRDGFPATVAVIRQQRDEAIRERDEARQFGEDMAALVYADAEQLFADKAADLDRLQGLLDRAKAART